MAYLEVIGPHIWWSNCCFSYSLKRHSKLPDMFFTVQCTVYKNTIFQSNRSKPFNPKPAGCNNISNLNLTNNSFFETQPFGSVPKTLFISHQTHRMRASESRASGQAKITVYDWSPKNCFMDIRGTSLEKTSVDTGSPIPANGWLNRLKKLSDDEEYLGRRKIKFNSFKFYFRGSLAEYGPFLNCRAWCLGGCFCCFVFFGSIFCWVL